MEMRNIMENFSVHGNFWEWFPKTNNLDTTEISNLSTRTGVTFILSSQNTPVTHTDLILQGRTERVCVTVSVWGGQTEGGRGGGTRWGIELVKEVVTETGRQRERSYDDVNLLPMLRRSSCWSWLNPKVPGSSVTWSVAVVATLFQCVSYSFGTRYDSMGRGTVGVFHSMVISWWNGGDDHTSWFYLLRPRWLGSWTEDMMLWDDTQTTRKKKKWSEEDLTEEPTLQVSEHGQYWWKHSNKNSVKSWSNPGKASLTRNKWYRWILESQNGSSRWKKTVKKATST